MDGEASAEAEVVEVDGEASDLLEQLSLDDQLVALAVHNFVRFLWLIQSQAPGGPASPDSGDVHTHGTSVGVLLERVANGLFSAVRYFDHGSILFAVGGPYHPHLVPGSHQEPEVLHRRTSLG